MNKLIDDLRVYVADSNVVSHLAHGAHWNVMGENFSQYHELFGEYYEDVDGAIDTLAEFLRQLGVQAPANIDETYAVKTIKSPRHSTDALELVAQLNAVNDVLISQLDYLFDCATNYKKQGIANFIADRQAAHDKWKWKFSASLGKEVTGAMPTVASSFTIALGKIGK